MPMSPFAVKIQLRYNARYEIALLIDQGRLPEAVARANSLLQRGVIKPQDARFARDIVSSAMRKPLAHTPRCLMHIA
ncbi:MAG: hypothetical protein ACAI35_23535 [Candidatus Methylacidiphilales bacterium]|nr:hypothetical protein [Candidatus Methylacidiphilales bacterium]